MTADPIVLAERYGPDGYRRIDALLDAVRRVVNDKWIERICQCAGVTVLASSS